MTTSPLDFFLPLRVDVAQASEGILPVDVHGARSTDPLSTGPTEGKRGILLGFDFDQCIQDHWAAVVEVHGISGEVLEIRPTRDQRYPFENARKSARRDKKNRRYPLTGFWR